MSSEIFDIKDLLLYASFMHMVERIRAVWTLRRLRPGELVELSGLSRNFIWDLKKKTFDLSYSSQQALAVAVRVPLRYFVDDELWENKSAEAIIALAALDAFFTQDDVPLRDRNDLKKAWDTDEVYFLEPQDWRKFYRGWKAMQTYRSSVAELRALPKVAEEPETYGTSMKSRASRRRKPAHPSTTR